MFASNGYPRTTINEIAANAEVGVNTVYTVFGTKANLLATLVTDAVANPVIACTLPAESKTGPTVIGNLAQLVRDNTERGYAIHHIGSQNARADPQIADAMHTVLTKIRHEMRRATQRLVDLGALSSDLSLDDGTDILYFYLGPPAWQSLFDLGWSLDRAHDFLAAQTRRALLRCG